MTEQREDFAADRDLEAALLLFDVKHIELFASLCKNKLDLERKLERLACLRLLYLDFGRLVAAIG